MEWNGERVMRIDMNTTIIECPHNVWCDINIEMESVSNNNKQRPALIVIMNGYDTLSIKCIHGIHTNGDGRVKHSVCDNYNNGE